MKKKRKLKKTFKILIYSIIMIISGIVAINIFKHFDKNDISTPTIIPDKQFAELKQKGFKNENINIIKKYVNKGNIKYIIDNNISEEEIMKFVDQDYYIDEYLKTYIEYQKENNNYTPREVIERVNTHVNNKSYTNTEATNKSLGKFVLLNKYYYADKDYHAEDLIDIDPKYSLYGTTYEIKLSKECFEAFQKMYEDAKAAGYEFKINSSYRSFDKQETIYNNYVSNDGVEKADTYSARPGYSEHQTGYAFDVRDYPLTNEDFSKTAAFTWVSENAYKYGFIIRFPKNKEEITGYQYESWHYRYCGTECSTYIHKTGITFEEYYEYFIKYKNPKSLS